MSQGGDGVGSSKARGQDKGKVVGKVTSTQLPFVTTETSCENIKNNIEGSKYRCRFAQTSNQQRVQYWWMIKLNNYKTYNNISSQRQREGCKFGTFKGRIEENLGVRSEKLRHLNSIMSQRVNDPLRLNKGDPNKVWCYKIIETIVLDGVDEFMKGKEELCY
ncbi:unnamed protein product [Lactuca saligna]|uniref:Uncharacterized protein n=1 Tax=Lactuca saligna TaxID=75948 RepID=A0AA35VGG0_LACSI|nr:unnamed protein product [Lactuca saligna]